MRILDVGCNDGLFPRLLAARAASVLAMTGLPRRLRSEGHEEAERLGVEYVIATPSTFSSRRVFDAATSVMVLNYASSIEELKAFFLSTSLHLVPGGRFVSIVLNPSFAAFGEDFMVRRITKLHGNAVRMEFFDDNTRVAKITAVQHQYTKEEFERAAVEGGMTPGSWTTYSRHRRGCGIGRGLLATLSPSPTLCALHHAQRSMERADCGGACFAVVDGLGNERKQYVAHGSDGGGRQLQ